MKISYSLAVFKNELKNRHCNDVHVKLAQDLKVDTSVIFVEF